MGNCSMSANLDSDIECIVQKIEELQEGEFNAPCNGKPVDLDFSNCVTVSDIAEVMMATGLFKSVTEEKGIITANYETNADE